jgi:hypothetical protein
MIESTRITSVDCRWCNSSIAEEMQKKKNAEKLQEIAKIDVQP